MMQYARSLLFNVLMYVAMPLVGLIYLPWAIFSNRGARAGCKAYCRWVFWSLRVLCGLQVEVRGTAPTDQVVIAAKHQSFLDVMAIFYPLPAGFFIMKKLLMYAPVIGQYGMRIGCVPVHRGKRGTAIKMMQDAVTKGDRVGGQLIIYPQGTRVAPGDHKSYKVGTFVLYEQMQVPCVPVATNIGVFWPKRGVLRKPGVAVIEFLEPIPIGLDQATFMQRLEETIETRSNVLMKEAGFHANSNN